MQRAMKVFVVPPERAPGEPPEPARQMVVEARRTDELLDAARDKLAAEGFKVRSLSFGPKGLVAYVEPSS